MLPSITVQDLAALRKDAAPPVLLDVREPWELDICQIEGNTNIPLGTLPQKAATLPKDQRIVVMCHHGGRSAQAALWLKSNGFSHVENLTGGIDAWAEHVELAMARY